MDEDVRILRMELLIELIFRALASRQDCVSKEELKDIYRRIICNPSPKLKKLNKKLNIFLFDNALRKFLQRFGFIKMDDYFSLVIFKGSYDLRPIGKALGLETLDYSYLSSLILAKT